MGRVGANALGSFGEAVAASFLERRGFQVVATNAFVDRDEIDIIYRRDNGLVAVEVKTARGGRHPLDALTEVKMRRLRRAVAGYGRPIVAIEAIGITIKDDGAEIRWLRGIW
jgi:Holliday junction resolvase-like predicted endonuclease